MQSNQPVLVLKDIVKLFPGVRALDGVHLEVLPGEIHALCGENGAGKSTLMKIISGAQRYTEGKMFVDGNEVDFHSTKDFRQIKPTIHQQKQNTRFVCRAGANDRNRQMPDHWRTHHHYG